MTKELKKGFFITAEGIDGSGKTTQNYLLADYLEKKGLPVVLTREPGGTYIGEKIRGIILDPENLNMSDMTEALLYAASRAQHMHEKISPALNAGKIVLCDRFVDSSLAYQGYARGINKEAIEQINFYATGGIKPDLTLLFNIEPETAMVRRQKDRDLDRIEKEALAFHRHVHEGYMELLKAHPDRYVCIDSSGEIDEIFLKVKTAVDLRLKAWNGDL